MSKRFTVKSGGVVRWSFPDGFSLEFSLDITDPSAFRAFLTAFNEKNAELVRDIGVARATGKSLQSLTDQYVRLMVEEYLEGGVE